MLKPESATFKNTLLIANPISGYGRTDLKLPAVLDVFKSAGWHSEVVVTAKAGDAADSSEGFSGDMIVCFGGDGTFNEILNAVDLSRVTLAVIPAGTGNVLAKELRMPLDPVKAAQSIVCGIADHFDVAAANGKRFACVCGAGLDALIVKLVHENRADNLTQFHYVPHLLKNLMPPTDWDIEVEADGEVIAAGVNLVCAGNTQSYGGLAELTPRADPQDGQLDITAMRLESPLDMLIPGIAALTHGLPDCGYTRAGRGRNIIFRSLGTDAPYHVDGDYQGTLPVRISIEPDSMRILRPARRLSRDVIIPL